MEGYKATPPLGSDYLLLQVFIKIGAGFKNYSIIPKTKRVVLWKTLVVFVGKS